MTITNEDEFQKAVEEIERFALKLESELSDEELDREEELALAIEEYENKKYGKSSL